ncbi:MAG: hypothetical protein U0172_03525 [Nitrospiraceae bacterium]
MAKKTKRDASNEDVQPKSADESQPDGLVRCKNLESWSGDTFSYAPQQIIDLPAEIAHARAEAGLVELL